MACPRCGATAYTLVGDGVAQCGGGGFLPTGNHPSGVAGPAQQFVACGARYQVPKANSTTFCDCGMGAVARCVDCSKDLCLDHSHRVQGSIRCAEHARTLQERAQEDAAERLASAWERLELLLEQVPAVVRDLPGEMEIDHRFSSRSMSDAWFSVSDASMKQLRVGADCPVCGPGCRVVVVGGRKQLHGSSARTRAWLLDHRCRYEHRHLTQSGVGSERVRILVLTGTGDLSFGQMPSDPLGIRPFEDIHRINHRPPLRGPERFESHARTAGVSHPAYIEMLVTRLGWVVNGDVGRAAGEACTPGHYL
jgi:hypothetical protein